MTFRKACFIGWCTFLLALPGISYGQTTTFTIPATGGTALPNSGRYGLVIGGSGNYGQSQLLKDTGFDNGSYIPQTVWNNSFACASGTTTTSWVSSYYGENAYPANFFAGAPYKAISQSGTILGSGTVTGSTSNIGDSGTITFTLPPLSATPTCGDNSAVQDILIVGPTTATLTPAQTFENAPSSAAFDTSDVPTGLPNGEVAAQSIVLPAGVTFHNWTDRALNAGLIDYANTSVQPTFMNFNGTYTVSYYAKCATAPCTFNISIGRASGASGFSPSSFTDTGTTTWTHYTHTTTGSETANASQTLMADDFSCSTNSCKMWGSTLIEGSTLSGNTTPFRDAVVQKLQVYKPGVLRFMNPGDWCSTVADMIAPDTNRRQCGMNDSIMTSLLSTYGYQDQFQLAQFLGTDIWIDMSKAPTAADATLLMQFLGGPSSTTGGAVRVAQGTSSTWTSLMGSHIIYIELGNEAWNNNADLSNESGNGTAYGAQIGPVIAAIKASPYYSSSQIKIIQAGQMSSFGTGGFMSGTMAGSGCTLSSRSACPDYVDVAPYLASGSVDNLTNPFQDYMVETQNFSGLKPTFSSCSDYQTTPALYLDQKFASTCYNVGVDVYEDNFSPVTGSATATQQTISQTFDGVGAALIFGLGKELQRRDAGISGPDNGFAFTDSYASSSIDNTSFGAWDATAYLATGPGQIGGAWVDPDKPWGIVEKLLNTSIGTNNYILPTTQSGTPTIKYTANNGVDANSAANLVNCSAHNDNGTNYTAFCFNTDTAAHAVAFAGAGAPVSGTSVSLTKFGSPTNAITDNADTLLVQDQTTAGTTAATVVTPTATTVDGSTLASYSLPAQSMIALTYSLGSAPAAPVITLASGSYSSTQTTTITDATSGSAIYYTLDGTTPTSSSAAYSSAITIASGSTTLKAIAIAGGISSSVVSASYTVTLPTTPVVPAVVTGSAAFGGSASIH